MANKFWHFATLTSGIWKTALAAGLAWDAATWTGADKPYFAPLAAILCLQVTVEESVWRGYQRVLGIIAGVLVADFAVHFFGVHGWSIALLVLVGTGIAWWLKLGHQAIPQVGVSAMMVLTVGAGNYLYSVDRVVDTILGAAIAVFINMWVVPPDYTKQAEGALASAALQLADRFGDIAGWLKHGADEAAGEALRETIHHYVDEVHTVRRGIEQALRAVRFSPLIRHRRQRLEYDYAQLLRLRQGYAHAAGMVRTLIEEGHGNRLPGDERLMWSERFEAVRNQILVWQKQVIPKPDWTPKLLHPSVQLGEPARKLLRTFEQDLDDVGHFALINDTKQLVEDFTAAAVWMNDASTNDDDKGHFKDTKGFRTLW